MTPYSSRYVYFGDEWVWGLSTVSLFVLIKGSRYKEGFRIYTHLITVRINGLLKKGESTLEKPPNIKMVERLSITVSLYVTAYFVSPVR